MSDHPGNDLLNAYLDGEMAQRDARRVEQHLFACSACSAALESLRLVAAGLQGLPAVEPTPDEHRAVRQRILDSRSAAPAGRFGSLQWALAGGLALVLIASVGFLFLGGPSPERSTSEDSLTAGVPELRTAEEVEDFVRSLPAVASARAGGGFAGQDEGAGGGSGGSGAFAGSIADGSGASETDDAGAKADDSTATDGAGEVEPGTTMQRAPAPAEGSEERAESEPSPPPAAGLATCAGRLAALQSDPVVLLTQHDVVYKAERALLVVFASQPTEEGEYERVLSLIVRDRDCAEPAGQDLAGAILYRSETTF